MIWPRPMYTYLVPVNVEASMFSEMSFIPAHTSRTVDFIETCSWISSLLLHGSLYAVLPTESQNKYEGENEPPDIENKFSPGLFTSTRLRHLAFYPVWRPLGAWQALDYRQSPVESSQSGSGRNSKDLLGWRRLYLTTNTNRRLHYDNMEMSLNDKI